MRQKSLFKTVLCLLVLIICSFFNTVQAHDWNALLTVDPYPSPYVSDWQNDPTLAFLEIRNNEQEQDVVIVSLEVFDESGSVIMKANSRRLLVDPGQPVQMNTTGYQNWNVSSLNSSTQEHVARTGMFPEGDYEICVSIRNLWGEEMVTETCSHVIIVHPEPPELIFPIDNEMLAMEFPVFQWIPPQSQYTSQVVYLVRLVEVLPGQIPERALEANYPHYENFNVFDSELEYPLDAMPLEAGKTYAWQVQAVDLEGRPATKNNGKSIIGLFSTPASFGEDLPELQLVTPENNARLTTNFPVFEWIEPLAVSDGFIYYTVRITEMFSGQTPEQAIETNTPSFVNAATITGTEFQYPDFAPALETGKNYAWQIRALDQFGRPVSKNEGKSETRLFTACGEITDYAETILIPEKLPLPEENSAYLLLKNGEKPLVNYSFSPDSTEITVSSLSPGTAPLIFPCLRGDMSDPPRIGATVDVTFNRYTLDIISGNVTASPGMYTESPFNLSRLGVPAAVQSIQYNPGSGEFSFSCMISMFNTLLRHSSVTLSLSPSGIISGTVPQQSLSEYVPLKEATKRLVYSVQSIQGDIRTLLISENHQTDLDISGSLVFLPYQADPGNRSIPLRLKLAGKEIQILSCGSIPEPEGITVPAGPVGLNLHNFSCNTFSWSSDYKTWDFDFAFDMRLSLHDLHPVLTLPQISSVHLTGEGFVFPQVSIPDLNTDRYFAYQDIQMNPYAFRMDAHTFDWFAWSGKDIGDWGLRFDFKVKFYNFASRLSQLADEINRNPLTVLNAACTDGIFLGKIEPRAYSAPIFAPFKTGGGHGLLIEKIAGEFREDQGLPVIDFTVSADCILPSVQGDGKQTVDLGDDALLMSTRGIFTGHSASFPLPHPLPWSRLQIGVHTSALVLSKEEKDQAAVLNLDGTIQIPVNYTSSVTAAGSGSFDLIAEKIVSGQFIMSDPFVIDVPAFTPAPSLQFKCVQGAVVNPDGLQIKDGPGELLVPGTPVSVRYVDNVTFNLPDLQLLSGTIEFDNTFAFQICNLSSNCKNMQWKAVDAGTSPLPDLNNLILPLPSSVKITNGILTAQGSTRASVSLNKKEFNGLDARFSDDFSVVFQSARVGSGRVGFYANNDQVAYLDSTGFWPGEFFIVDSLLAILPLPDSSIAYVQLQDQYGNSLTGAEQAGENIRLFTRDGQKVNLYLPALSFNSGNIPVVQTSLDVIVNPSTLRMVSGSISLDASSGGELVSLAASGVPLSITALKYNDAAGTYTMHADVKPILPKALRGTDIGADNVALTAEGFETFDTGYSHSYKSGSSAGSVHIGDYLEVTFDGMRVNTASSKDSVRFSGNILVDVFTGPNNTEPLAIHYYADLSTDSAGFNFSTSNWSNGALPFGCGTFEVITANGMPQMSVSAPVDENTFDFKILQGVLSFAGLCNGFNITIEDFTVSQNGISIPDVSFSSGNEQILSLFGTDIKVTDVSFDVKSPKLLEMILNGSLTLFGVNIDFSGLSVNTDCAIGNTNLSINPIDFVPGSLSLDSLRIKNNRLNVHGSFTAIKPFDGMASTYAIRIDTDGNWVNKKGDVLSKKKILVISRENPQDEGVSLGMNPLDVVCKLAKAEIEFNGFSNKEAAGNISTTINSYWPSVSDTKTMVPIIGSISFPCTDITRNSWLIDENTVSVISLADLLNLEMKNICILNESEFTISLGGNFSLNLSNLGDDQGGGGEFKDFLLKEGAFQFGEVLNGDFDLGGVNVQLSRFAFGFDLNNFEAYDVTFNKNEASAKPAKLSHNGFYLVFGGSISSEMFGFDGGIDSLLIYKSSERFHTVIKNAHFVYSDMIDGALDLILDVNLTEVDFKFLVGGHLDVMEKGFAAVGEISYKNTSFNGQTFMCPGFGLFLAAKTGLDIRLTPIPITIEGFGLGVFFNPDPLIEEWVRSHLGFENGTEDQYFFDAYNDYRNQFTNMMTFLEIYTYVNISVPEKAVLEAQALLTLATDKLRLDMKATIGGEKFKKYCNLEGSGFLEVGVPQDFSSWPYAAGNITVGMAAKDQTGVKLINLPSPGEATSKLEFFVVDGENWALHGAVCAEVVKSLEADFEFFIGPPGFLVRAGMSKSFDAVVVEVEVGMELSVWYVWQEPKEWGGYARAWVQATLLSEAFAGVRGELGAALVGKPDFYIYGYAELSAWFLDIEWTKCVWVEWRDGEIDGGTGGDSRMQEIIEHASDVSDRIMEQVDDIEYTILQTKREAFTQLSPQDIKNIINTIRSGQSSFYWSDLKDDSDAVISGLNYYINHVKDKENGQKSKSIFMEYKGEVINSFNPDTIGVLNGALNEYSAGVEGLNTALSDKIDDYKKMYDGLKSNIQNSSFTLDTLIAFSNIPDSPIEDPLTMGMMDVGGKIVPSFSVDNTKAAGNEENAGELQQSFDAWLDEVIEKLNKIETLRSQLYSGFGPASDISKTQSDFINSFLEKNTMERSLLNKVSYFYEFYHTKKERCYTLYRQNINEFNQIFILSRWDPVTGGTKDAFVREAVDRRYGALKSLAGGEISINPSIFEDWEASEELAIIFYTTVPFLFYDFTLDKMDSLYNAMVPAYNDAFLARNDIHRDFTSQTDAVWERYAELSESLYNLYDALIDEVKTYEKTYGTSPSISSEEINDRMKILSNEFMFSSLPGFSVNRTGSEKRYAPVTVGFNWTENKDVSEYAFSISEDRSSKFQSTGNRSQFGLDFFLPVSWPPARKQYEVRTRVRNKAGYEVAGQIVDVSLEKSITKTSSDINVTTPVSGSDLIISAVNFPDSYASSGISCFKNSGSQIHVDWDINTSKGPSPFAEFRYTVYSQDSPDNPVADWTSAGTLTEVTIRDLNLNANTTLPYIVQIAGYDVEGNVSHMKESSSLYIDHTPPHFPNDIREQLIRPYGENRVVFQCIQARDWFSDENSNPNLYVRIDTLAAYQYKLYYTSENPDSLPWQSIDSYALPEYDHVSYKGCDFIHIDLGVRPHAGDMKLALRAQNLHASNNNGFGEMKIVSIPRQEDMTPPKAPSFKIAGKDENGNIILNIVSAAEDQESGIAGYNYKIIDAFQDQRIIRDYPENALQVDFPADSVYPGKTLIIPIDHESLDIRGMWIEVFLTGVNYSGNPGGSDIGFICFPPAKPELKAALEHVSISGSKAYTILKFEVSTDPHPADFTVAMRFGTTDSGNEIKSIGYLFGPSHGNTLQNRIRLPDSLTYGSPVYVTAWSVSRALNNRREKSDSVKISLMTPDPPMFTMASQNQEGYLALPIISPAFNGRKPAVYQFEIQSELNETRSIIRPFPVNPLQADFTDEDVQPGEQLILPVLVKDSAPKICVKLRARSTDGDIAEDETVYYPVPPLPEFTGRIIRYKLMKDYQLELKGDFSNPVMQGNSSLHFILGSEKGKDDIKEGVCYCKNGSGSYSLTDNVSEYAELYLSVKNVTSCNKQSASCDTILSVPPPLMFDHVKKNDTGNLMVHMLSSGLPADAAVSGYQFGVFRNDESRTPIRAFPENISDFDFSSQEVVKGEYLELPVHISELPLQKLVVVGVKAISSTGESVTYERGYMPYPPIPADAFITRDKDENSLRFKGTFKDIYLFGGRLTVYFALGSNQNDDDVLSGQFEINTGGDYNSTFHLGGNLEVGEFYYLSSWYIKNNEKSGVYQQKLTLPCEPMFNEIKQPDEQSLALPIVSAGFDDSPSLAGYQYALGSASGNYDVRPFPSSSENIDFTPDQVKKNQDLIIQRQTLGLPEQCFVALKAINSNGVTDLCEQSFRPKTATPVIRLLSLRQPQDGKTNILRFELENTSIDGKTAMLVMSAYYGSGHSIIVTPDAKYSYPTWDWSVYYNANQSNRVFECHFTKMMPIDWDYFIEVKSVDRYRQSESGVYKLKFNIDMNLNLIDIVTIELE